MMKVRGKIIRILSVLVLLTVAMTVSTFAVGEPELIVEYDFDNNLVDEKGNSSITIIDTDTDGFGSNPAAGSDQTYWEWTSPSYPNGGGLQLDIDQDISSSYSIGVRFSYNDIEAGWNKIIDYKNRGADTGFYFNSGGYLEFYNQGGRGSTLINDNQIVDIIATRDGDTNTFIAYIVVDGVLAKEVEVDDSSQQAMPTVVGGSPRFGFFYDDGNGEGSQDGGKVYSIKVWNGPITQEQAEDAMSSLPDLSNLVISQGTLTPVFSADTTNYTTNVTNDITELTVTPTAAEPASTIKVNTVAVNSGDASGNISLNVGDNTIEIEVTAEDGVTKKTYTIVVNRAAPATNGTYMTTVDNENNAGEGVADGDLDDWVGSAGAANNIDIHPIEFNINVTGSLPSSTASLAIKAYDVDEEAGEIDDVYLNGTKVGSLYGTNSEWSVTVIDVPTNLVLSGDNLVQIYVDDSSDDPYDDEWETEVDYGQLIIDGGDQSDATITNLLASYDNVGDTIDAEFDYTGTTNGEMLTVEYVLTREMSTGTEMIDSHSENYTNVANNDAQTFSHSFPITLAGDYSVTVMIRNDSDEVVAIDKVTNIIVDPLSPTGSGTIGDPYSITTREHLEDVSFYVLDPNVYIEMAGNIDLSAGNWTPIGNDELMFKGHFDGQGYSITNMTINTPLEDYIGLFGGTYDATITNIVMDQIIVDGDDETAALIGIAYRTNVSDITITNADIEGQDDYIGGIVGRLYDSTINDASFSGSVTGDDNIGGAVGDLYRSSLTNISTEGTVNGADSIGGVVGDSIGVDVDTTYFTNISSSSNITGDDYVGGIAGELELTTLRQSFATGTVITTGKHTGGLVGYNDSGDILQCYYYNQESPSIQVGEDYAGGIIGTSRGGSISESFAVFNMVVPLSTDVDEAAGGITGYSNTNISDSYAIGTMQVGHDGSDDVYVGGISGYHDGGTIENVFADVMISGGDFGGGVLGYNDGSTLSNAYYVENQISSDDLNSEGTGLTFIELKDHSLLNSFDFNSIWSNTMAGRAAPSLQWNNADDDYDFILPVIKTAKAKLENGKNKVIITFDEAVTIKNANNFVIEVDDVVVNVDQASELVVNGEQAVVLEIDYDYSTITNEVITLNYTKNGTAIVDSGNNELGDSTSPLVDITDYVVNLVNSDTSLSGLVISEGNLSPDFVNNIISYDVTLPYLTSSITVTPTLSDNNSTLKINEENHNSGQVSNPINLSYGLNTIVVKVTGEDNSTTEYVIKVRRNNPPSNNNSSSNDEPDAQEAPDNEEKEVIVIVNEKEYNAGTEKVLKDGEEEVVIIEVETEIIDAKIEEVLANNDVNSENVFQVPIVNQVSEKSRVKLTGDIVKKLEDNTFDVSIKRGAIEYIIPAEEMTIDQVAEKLNVNSENLIDIEIEVEISEVEVENKEKYTLKSNELGASLIVEPISFNVYAKTTSDDGEEKVEKIDRYTKYVERIVELPDGVDADKITTGIVFNDDGSYSHVPTEIVEINGRMYAKLNSLSNSDYSVVWNPIEVSSVSNHWSKDIINDMASRLVVFNHLDFRPNDSITRADFTEYIVRALGLYRKVDTMSINFNDVKKTHDRALGIYLASQNKLINGYPDGSFKPDNLITREEAMTMYYKAMLLTDLKGVNPERYLRFNDNHTISKWAKESVIEVLSASVFNGNKNNNINPSKPMTYAEAVQAIRNLLVESKLIND